MKGVKIGRRIMDAPPLRALQPTELYTADVRDDAGLSATIRQRADTIYHPVGTCRMGGADNPQAVVDPTLKVHGVDGLYVMDASVFPTNTSVNPQHSIMSVATVAMLVTATL